jgi:hypothetical protein
MSEQEEIDKINSMSHIEMAHLYRFAPAGHPYFIAGSPLSEAFYKRWNELGRMTPAISKAIGWEGE